MKKYNYFYFYLFCLQGEQIRYTEIKGIFSKEFYIFIISLYCGIYLDANIILLNLFNLADIYEHEICFAA